MTPKEANYKLSKTIEAFWSAFVDAEKHEIEVMLAAAKGWTPTNCWWVQYRAKDFIINLLEAKLQDIDLVSKKN